MNERRMGMSAGSVQWSIGNRSAELCQNKVDSDAGKRLNIYTVAEIWMAMALLYLGVSHDHWVQSVVEIGYTILICHSCYPEVGLLASNWHCHLVSKRKISFKSKLALFNDLSKQN